MWHARAACCRQVGSLMNHGCLPNVWARFQVGGADACRGLQYGDAAAPLPATMLVSVAVSVGAAG